VSSNMPIQSLLPTCYWISTGDTPAA